MNIARIWLKVCWMYIGTPMILWITLLGVINSVLWVRIGNLFPSKLFSFFCTDIINPFFLYILMIISTIMVYYGRYKNISFDSHIKRSLIYSLPIMLVKLLWNCISGLLMGIEYYPDDRLNLFPALLLFFFWVLIFLFSAAIIPRIIINSKNIATFNYVACINYIRFSLWYLMGSLFWSLATAGILMFLLALFFSYLNEIFIFLASPMAIKLFFEDIISGAVQIFFAQLLSVSSLYIYLKKSNNFRKGFKIYNIE